VVTGTLPTGAAGGQKYSVAITGGSVGSGSNAVTLGSGADATLTVTATYLVGDAYPFTTDAAPNFGDNSLDIRDLVQELFAVTSVPGFRPAACSDRLDAMDTYPADTAGSRGGDGSLDIRDLILELFRTTALDPSRPVRTSLGGACAGTTHTMPATAAPEPQSVASRLAVRSEGALELGAPEALSDGEARVPVYLEASRTLARIALALSLGDLQSNLRFTAVEGLAPSLASDAQQGVVAIAWANGINTRAGERLLLGYVQGPAATAADWGVFGISASGLDDNREVHLSAAAPQR